MKLITLLFFLSIFTSFSQTFNGKVLDRETNNPIENVNVFLDKEEIGTITNEKGEFNLTLHPKIKTTDTIHFSIIGYTSKHISLSKLKQLNFTIHLSKKTEHLNEVIVAQKKKLKTQIPFKKLSSLKRGVYNFGSILINNNIYVIGGDQSFIEDTEKKVLDEVSNIPGATFADLLKRMRPNFTWESYSEKLQIYTIKNNSWIISDIKLKKRAYHKIVQIENKLYILGGKTLTTKYEYLDNTIEVLDLKTNKVVIDKTNPHQAVNFAALSYQDNIIAMGGSIKLKKNGEKVYSNKSHIYNTTSGYWYELPKMTKPKEVNGIVVENKIYLIGGFNKEPLTEIESYNLTNGTWKKEGHLFSGMENPSLAYSDNIIYIFSNGKILTYNTTTKILNEYKIGLYTKGSQMHYSNNKLYILGGFNEDDFTKLSTSNLNVISIDDFLKTKIINTTVFN